MKCALLFAAVSTLAVAVLHAESESGSVSGRVVDPASGEPLEFVVLTLKEAGAGQVVGRTASDPRGTFHFEGVPPGNYVASYGVVGAEPKETSPFRLTAERRTVDLGSLALTAGGTMQLEKIAVTARKQTFDNSIDRKVYNVGTDLKGTSGSASDLLQNIPSVQVDLDGNVSLRGDSNVLILIDGKPSTLMSAANRADALAQLPADAIERIEVITNPSARYKPDGTAGIINISMRHQHDPGYSGTWRANVGNENRSNTGISANYNSGALNVYGSANVRQDDRPRYSHETRGHIDPTSDTLVSTTQDSIEHSRPLTRLVQLGVDFRVDKATQVGASASYNYRTFFRTSSVNNLTQAADGTTTTDYDRLRTDPEWQKTVEVGLTGRHSFADPDHELSVELKSDRHWEQESNQYTNIYRTPSTPTSLDDTRIRPTETGTEVTADYAQPGANGATIAAGYAGEWNTNDMDFRGRYFDPALGGWVVDPTRTNHFIYRDSIQALYATYGRPFGRFGVLGGIRLEQTNITTNQITTQVRDRQAYLNLYPSLHLSYDLSDTRQLQLNYSRRVHRPDTEDLNPFPEYQDPFNLREGNPRLQPEETNSVEAGFQYRRDTTTYLATLYARETQHAFTLVTRYIDAVTLLTTHENLASNRSGGLELAAMTPLGAHLSLNASANVYYSEVDATNLGFAGNRSAIAWDAKLNLNWQIAKLDLVQLNSNYTAKRLTAQGYRLPTYVANLGWRHDFAGRRLAFVLTISDLFNSLKERTVIDTPSLHDDTIRRRSSRIILGGFVYNFGKPAKKKKDDSLQFDNQF